MRRLLVAVGLTAALTWFVRDAWSASANDGDRSPAAAAMPGAAEDRLREMSAADRAAAVPDRALLARVAALESKVHEAEAAREAEQQAFAARLAQARPAVSEVEVGAVMQRAIDREPRDHAWIAKATSEIEARLAALPHLALEDVACGRQFCRASFFRPDGQEFDSAQVVSVVPLENEAFTVETADHRMEVYFSRAGAATIETIRQEQLALRRGN